MKRRERLKACVDRLSSVLANGELLAATDPAALLEAAADEILSLRAKARSRVLDHLDVAAKALGTGPNVDGVVRAARYEIALLAIATAAQRLCALGQNGENVGIDDNPIFSDEWGVLEDAVKAAEESGLLADHPTSGHQRS